MTEDEAKKMRCCSGSAAHPQHDGGCCASQCMAWRWEFEPIYSENEEREFHWTDIFGPQLPSLPPRIIGAKCDHGYCGLAGKT